MAASMRRQPPQWSTPARGFSSPARRFSGNGTGRRQWKRSVPLFRPGLHEVLRRKFETDSIRLDRGDGRVLRRVPARQSTADADALGRRPRDAEADQGADLPAWRGAVRQEALGEGADVLLAPLRELSERSARP